MGSSLRGANRFQRDVARPHRSNGPALRACHRGSRKAVSAGAGLLPDRQHGRPFQEFRDDAHGARPAAHPGLRPGGERALPRIPATGAGGRRGRQPEVMGWEPVLLPILERDPAVQAVTLLRHLQMTEPDAFADVRVRRTLERRVRDWRAARRRPRRDLPPDARARADGAVRLHRRDRTRRQHRRRAVPAPALPLRGLQRLGANRRRPRRRELHRKRSVVPT